jgi:hypothetical protein
MGHGKGKSATYHEPIPAPVILPDSCEWQWVGLNNSVHIFLNFPVEMQQNVIDPNSFTVKLDGIPVLNNLAVSWVNEYQFLINTQGGQLYPTAVTISYSGADPNFKSLLGVLVSSFTDLLCKEII